MGTRIFRYQAVAAAFRKADKPALMTVYANNDAWDTSNVWFDNARIRLFSKREKLTEMRYIDYGLKELGFLLVVVTNQPDVGRGTPGRETVEPSMNGFCNSFRSIVL
jgi:hypothetical protein